MLTREDLLATSEATGLKPHQQEKHYVQALALRFIYGEVSDELIFKGGTALWFFHGLNRFSNDLDFSLTKELDLSRLMERVRRSFELMNLPLTMRKTKDDRISSSFRIGVEGPLFTKEIERCFVNFEISKRRDVIRPPAIIETDPVYPDILPFSVPVMGMDEIAMEKVRAVITRDYARDAYDLWFLLRKKRVEVDLKLIEKKLDYYGKRFEMKEFRDKLHGKGAYWESELGPLVIGTLPKFEDVEREIVGAFARLNR